MSTESKAIVTVHQTSSLVKSTTITHHLFKNIEILKTFVTNLPTPRRFLSGLIVSLTTIALVLIVLWGNFVHQANAVNSSLTSDFRHQTVLSNYLQTVGNLILENNSRKNKEKSAILRAMTQVTLQELDPERKRYVVMFLHDANLLHTSSAKKMSLLVGANLVGANLQGLNLKFANLRDANLTGVDLRGADLRGANLDDAILTKACYNSETFFEKNFDPVAAGMKEVGDSQGCFFGLSRY